jgi:hypothetical protein
MVRETSVAVTASMGALFGTAEQGLRQRQARGSSTASHTRSAKARTTGSASRLVIPHHFPPRVPRQRHR